MMKLRKNNFKWLQWLCANLVMSGYTISNNKSISVMSLSANAMQLKSSSFYLRVWWLCKKCETDW